MLQGDGVQCEEAAFVSGVEAADLLATLAMASSAFAMARFTSAMSCFRSASTALKSDYLDWACSEASQNGVLYSLPWGAGPMILLYRQAPRCA
jgi:hypothetical protein